MNSDIKVRIFSFFAVSLIIFRRNVVAKIYIYIYYSLIFFNVLIMINLVLVTYFP